MAEDDDAVELNAEIEVQLTPYGSLDLDEDWVAYLNQSAEIPPTVAGVDSSITYEEDGGGSAVA